jgi:antitoxin (DNA-binding transcriptional repressor) of toxin-antitoxin stability system
MVLKKIDLDTITITLEELLAELDTDTEILLTKGDAPVARIANAKAKPVRTEPRILGLHEGQGWISDDFADKLPESFWFGNRSND